MVRVRTPQLVLPVWILIISLPLANAARDTIPEGGARSFLAIAAANTAQASPTDGGMASLEQASGPVGRTSEDRLSSLAQVEVDSQETINSQAALASTAAQDLMERGQTAQSHGSAADDEVLANGGVNPWNLGENEVMTPESYLWLVFAVQRRYRRKPSDDGQTNCACEFGEVTDNCTPGAVQCKTCFLGFHMVTTSGGPSYCMETFDTQVGQIKRLDTVLMLDTIRSGQKSSNITESTGPITNAVLEKGSATQVINIRDNLTKLRDCSRSLFFDAVHNLGSEQLQNKPLQVIQSFATMAVAKEKLKSTGLSTSEEIYTLERCYQDSRRRYESALNISTDTVIHLLDEERSAVEAESQKVNVTGVVTKGFCDRPVHLNPQPKTEESDGQNACDLNNLEKVVAGALRDWRVNQRAKVQRHLRLKSDMQAESEEWVRNVHDALLIFEAVFHMANGRPSPVTPDFLAEGGQHVVGDSIATVSFADFADMFRDMDKDGDFHVSRKEWQANTAVKTLGAIFEHLAVMGPDRDRFSLDSFVEVFTRVDVNRDYEISMDEFVRWFSVIEVHGTQGNEDSPQYPLVPRAVHDEEHKAPAARRATALTEPKKVHSKGVFMSQFLVPSAVGAADDDALFDELYAERPTSGCNPIMSHQVKIYDLMCFVESHDVNHDQELTLTEWNRALGLKSRAAQLSRLFLHICRIDPSQQPHGVRRVFAGAYSDCAITMGKVVDFYESTDINGDGSVDREELFNYAGVFPRPSDMYLGRREIDQCMVDMDRMMFPGGGPRADAAWESAKEGCFNDCRDYYAPESWSFCGAVAAGANAATEEWNFLKPLLDDGAADQDVLKQWSRLPHCMSRTAFKCMLERGSAGSQQPRCLSYLERGFSAEAIEAWLPQMLDDVRGCEAPSGDQRRPSMRPGGLDLSRLPASLRGWIPPFRMLQTGSSMLQKEGTREDSTRTAVDFNGTAQPEIAYPQASGPVADAGTLATNQANLGGHFDAAAAPAESVMH